VYQDVTSLDQRLADLQSQLDRLTVSLQLWRDRQEHLSPAEERLADLTRQCADIVSQWGTTGQRQARAVGELEERVAALSAAEERLHQDTADRLRALERVVEQEWTDLRRIHEEPVRELREHADTLSRVSIAATSSSISGFDRAEARLVEIEHSLTQKLAGVSDQLAVALAEIRSLAPARLHDVAPSQAWPIEGVVRLHNQLRESTDAGVSEPALVIPASRALRPALPDVASDHIDVAEPDMVDADSRPLAGRGWRAAIAVALVAAIAAAAAGAFVIRRDARLASDRAANAERQAQAVVAAANQQLEAVREESARQLAQAKAGADRAQAVGDVLASPDLVRFNIAGAGPTGISGQVLWSRSRGVVFSGVRVPPAPEHMTYQLWLLTDALPVTAGIFVPEPTGRVTFTAEPPRVPRPVVGAALTIEPEGGSETPSELLVRNRIPRPAQ
jgi:hypothetical protein